MNSQPPLYSQAPSPESISVDPEMDITTYYKTISAKGKVVMREKRAKGEVMHKAPLGYKNARDDLGRSVLVPDPATHHLVQEAIRLHQGGMSIRKICREMEHRGLRNRRGKVLGASAMWEVLLAAAQKNR
jgi:hypothetical protein